MRVGEAEGTALGLEGEDGAGLALSLLAEPRVIATEWRNEVADLAGSGFVATQPEVGAGLG